MERARQRCFNTHQHFFFWHQFPRLLWDYFFSLLIFLHSLYFSYSPNTDANVTTLLFTTIDHHNSSNFIPTPVAF